MYLVIRRLPNSGQRNVLVGVGLCLVMVFVTGTASAQQSSEKKEVISFGNDDAKNAPPINVIRERPRRGDASSVEDEFEGEEGSEVSAEGDVPIKGEILEEEEPEIVDSFVVLKGNRRFHLPSCPLVTSAKREKSTKNGASVIQGRYSSCAICKPPAPVKNPSKTSAVAKGDATTGTQPPQKRANAPKGRAPKPERKPIDADDPELKRPEAHIEKGSEFWTDEQVREFNRKKSNPDD